MSARQPATILDAIETSASSRSHVAGTLSRIKPWAVQASLLVVLGLVLGWAYDWAAPRLYQPEQAAGFRLGIAHGALMPVALPTLLMGRDVPIFASHSTGRTYKLGYILGINLCGMAFFGLAFRKPRPLKGTRPARDPVAPPPSQPLSNQPQP